MQLNINGTTLETDFSTLHSVRDAYLCTHSDIPPQNLVTIYNGYQTADDHPLADGDQLNFIEKGAFPEREELKSMLYARHTPHVQEHLEHATVAIAGLGGLGSNIAVMLARTGIGRLHLIDFDVVEPSNLNRQQYLIRHLGLPKTEALRELISQINPYCEIEISTCRVTEDNIETLFADATIVCEAFDSPEAKAMLVTGIRTLFPDKNIVAASGMAGLSDSNLIQTRQMGSHFYLCGDGTSAAAPGMGLMAPRVTICAAHQANKILQLLVEPS